MNTPSNSLLFCINSSFSPIDSFFFGFLFAVVGSLKKSKEGNYLITRVYKSTLVTLASQSSGDPGTSQPTLLHWSIFTVGLDTILCPWCVTKAYEGRENEKERERGKRKNVELREGTRCAAAGSICATWSSLGCAIFAYRDLHRN